MVKSTHDIRKLARSRDAFDAACAHARRAKTEAVVAWRDSGGHISPPSWEFVDPKNRWAAVAEAAQLYDVLSRIGFSPRIFADIAWMTEMPTGSTAGRVTDVLRWLEEDPFCLNSGFYKQRVLRLLRRFDFTEEQADQMRRIVVAVIQRGPRQEFRELRRITPRVDSPALRDSLRRLAATSDAGTAWRAAQLLGACERVGRRSGPPRS